MKSLAVIALVAAFPFSVPLSAPSPESSLVAVPMGQEEAVPVDYSVGGYEGIMCDSDIECEEATGYPYDTAFDPEAPKYPRLVGHGCKGANGPIYAFEEDHFPKCREIVAMDWDWKEKINE